jgi:hypothetical protein
MAPHRFRWSRVQRVLYTDPTALLELLVTVFYCLMQGIFLAVGQTQMPGPVESWLLWSGLTSERFGLSLVLLALLQIWSAGTEWYKVRGWISFTIAFNALFVALAYWFAGVTDRFVFPFLLGTIGIEGFLAARDWHEGKGVQQAHRVLEESLHGRSTA